MNALNIELWPIDRPREYARNARKITDLDVAKMADLLREFGMRQPVVVDREGVIVIGHRRRRAWKLLGNTEVPVHVADELTPAKVRALRIADNRVGADVANDFDILKTELGDLKAESYDLSMTAMEAYEIAPLLAIAEEIEPEAPEGDAGDVPQKMKVIKVTEDQYSVIHQVIERVRAETGEPSMSDGRALELWAADSLAG